MERLFSDGQIGGAILNDLTKAFDCINHALLIAKLAAYVFSYKSLNFFRSYLTDGKQRIKIKHTCSSNQDVTCGVLHSSIVRPLLFSINICGMFLFNSSFDIASYVVDNSLYIGVPTKANFMN